MRKNFKLGNRRSVSRPFLVLPREFTTNYGPADKSNVREAGWKVNLNLSIEPWSHDKIKACFIDSRADPFQRKCQFGTVRFLKYKYYKAKSLEELSLMGKSVRNINSPLPSSA